MHEFFTPRKKIASHTDEPISDEKREPTPVMLTFINYENNLPIKERQAPAFNEDMAFVNMPGVTWLDIDGVHQT